MIFAINIFFLKIHTPILLKMICLNENTTINLCLMFTYLRHQCSPEDFGTQESGSAIPPFIRLSKTSLVPKWYRQNTVWWNCRPWKKQTCKILRLTYRTQCFLPYHRHCLFELAKVIQLVLNNVKFFRLQHPAIFETVQKHFSKIY